MGKDTPSASWSQALRPLTWKVPGVAGPQCPPYALMATSEAPGKAEVAMMQYLKWSSKNILESRTGHANRAFFIIGLKQGLAKTLKRAR